MKKVLILFFCLLPSVLLTAQTIEDKTALLEKLNDCLNQLKLQNEHHHGGHYHQELPEATSVADIVIENKRIAFYLDIPIQFLEEQTDEHFFEEVPLRLFSTVEEHIAAKSFELRVKNTKGKWVNISAFYEAEIPTVSPSYGPGDGGLEIYSSDDEQALLKSNPIIGQAQPTGALSGKTVWLSPGHGWLYYTSLGDFSTQRGETNDMVEDFGSVEGVNYYLLKYLWNAGANVWSVRERDYNENMVIVDNTDAGYQETGAWSTTSNTGFNPSTNNYDQSNGYRFSGTTNSGAATSTATWTPNIPKEGLYWVSTTYRAFSDRPIDAQYEVNHAGGTTLVSVNQEVHGETWVYLGQFYFDAGSSGSVTLLNSSTDPAASQFVIADAMRFGGGTGTELDCTYGTGPTDKPRWEESARMYAPFMGYPSCRGDVTMRPNYAEYELAKGTSQEQNNACYVSWHTNAASGTARGTVTYAYDGSNSSYPVTTGSYDLQNFIQSSLADDIIDCYDSGWNDRGVKYANFGELRELQTMPGCLVEVAFHDNAADAEALTTPRFREIAARGIYQGIVEYFADKDGVSPEFMPEAPTHLYAKNSGNNEITLSWNTPINECGTEAATSYKIYMGTHGRAFPDGFTVTGNSYTFTGLNPSSTYYFRVSAVNAGGESFPSAIVAAKTPNVPGCATDFLIVDGFDRIDRASAVRKTSSSQLTDLRRLFLELMNNYDYMVDHAKALDQCNVSFDGCANEAIIDGQAILNDYPAINWYTGEESTVDNSLNTTERNLLQNYLDANGCLIISGAEIGWDIGRASSGNADVSFYNNYLKAAYVGDDANSYSIAGNGSGIFAGINGSFDDNTFCYFDAEYPDRLAAFGGSTVDLNYSGGTGDGAATAYSGADFAVVYFGFPLETTDALTRDALMCNAVDFLSDHQSPPVLNCQNITRTLAAGINSITILPEEIDPNILNYCDVTTSLSPSTFDCTDVGDNPVTLTLNYAGGNSIDCPAVVTIIENVDPVAICPAITPVFTLSAAGTVTVPVNSLGDGSSTDNCQLASEQNNAQTFTCSDIGTQMINITAFDAAGNSDQVNCPIIIQDLIIPDCSAQNVTVYLNASGTGSTSASAVNNNSSDVCGITNLQISQSNFTCAEVGTNPIILTVFDNAGLSNTCAATVTVLDTISPVCSTKDINLSLNANGLASITANDIDDGSSDACGIASYALDKTNFDCNDVGTTPVQLTVTDNNGNSKTCTAQVTVSDQTNPNCMSQNIQAYLDNTGAVVINANQVDNSSSDACGISSLTVSPSVFDCMDLGNNSVTLNVMDSNGRSTICSATVEVIDNILPQINCPNDLLINADAAQCFASNVNLGQATASDNCSIMSITNDAPNLFGVGTTIVTWTASDNSNLSITCQQMVTVSSNSFTCTDDGDCSNGEEVYNPVTCICEQINIPDPSTCLDDGDCSNGVETWNSSNCTCEQINVPDPSTCLNDGVCANGEEIWNTNNCVCEQINVPNPSLCVSDGNCSNGDEQWNTNTCVCEQINIPDPSTCVDDLNCSNGLETWNNNNCICEHLNVPNPASCIDDNDCSNGLEQWSNSLCVCEQVNIPDPTTCVDDGICSNGQEQWNASNCSCEQINVPDPTTCQDDSLCANGQEVWDSGNCICTQINVPDPATCVDDGNCANGDEIWNNTTCNCDQVNVPDTSSCQDDGLCGNGEEIWNNATCQCEQINLPDPSQCQDDNQCVNGDEFWNSNTCQCEQQNIPDPSACLDDGICANGEEFWNSTTCTCDQLNIPNPNICVSDGDCVNGIETWNNALCICEALNPLGSATFSSPQSVFCPDDGAVVLIPLNPGGAFTGPGVAGNIFDPSTIPVANYDSPLIINYTISNATCSETTSQTFTVNSCAAPISNVRLKLFFEGNYTANGMHNDLFTSGLVPFNQPYAVAPWNANFTAMAMSPPTNTVDWVLIEAYQGSPQLTGSKGLNLIEAQVGLLLTDGNIVSPTGATGVDFQNLSQGDDYYFIVRHRNHLDVLTASALTAANVVNYDFTLSENAAFGIEQLKQMPDGKYALYAGDYNRDAVIQNTDYDDWFVDPSILNIYMLTDGNLDGVVQTTDYDTWFVNKAKLGTLEITY